MKPVTDPQITPFGALAPYLGPSFCILRKQARVSRRFVADRTGFSCPSVSELPVCIT